MRRHSIAARAVVRLLVFCFLSTMLLSTPGLTKPVDCPYDKANPSLENARLSFRTLNYACAEQEIEAFLLLEEITIEEKADAHVLLAAVYYAKLKNDADKRNQVINQFKEAFKAYRAWKGDLDISSTEFFEMMQTAQTMVDQEAEDAPAEQEAEPPVVVEKPAEDDDKQEIAAIVELPEDEKEEDVVTTMPPYQGDEDTQVKASKPWYKKWWAIGLGVGLIAVVAVAAGGGGGSDDGGTVDTDLPDFPDPPTSQENSPNKNIK